MIAALAAHMWRSPPDSRLPPIHSLNDCSMKLLLHDYGAYPFSRELAEILEGEYGVEVVYSFNGSLEGTPSGWAAGSGVTPTPITLPRPLRREKFVDRWRLENLYGRKLAELVRVERPDVALFANTPVDALVPAGRACHKLGISSVVWVQDLLGEAISQVLAEKFGGVAAPLAAWYRGREASCLRRADHLISISDAFAGYFDRHAIGRDDWTLIPNWAPLQEIVPRAKQNPWSWRHEVSDKFTFMYSGTLGFKHRPELLVELAEVFRADDGVRVVVNSSGAVAEWLRDEARKRQLSHLVINGFQPIEELPDVLASADVLIGMLAPDAATYCVPSKILSNHCAGRAQLLSISEGNPAAKLVMEHRTGLVADPDDQASFLQAARRLYSDTEERAAMARRARETAEAEFDIEIIAPRFLEVLNRVRPAPNTVPN